MLKLTSQKYSLVHINVSIDGFLPLDEFSSEQSLIMLFLASESPYTGEFRKIAIRF